MPQCYNNHGKKIVIPEVLTYNLSVGSGQSDIGPPLDASVRNLESPDLVSHVLEE